MQLFWGIDKPMVTGNSALFAFTRLGKYLHDIGEGWIYRSDNILTESDPEKIRWQLLPESGLGIRNEEIGGLQEEHNIAPLPNDGLYCIYRTKRGFAADSYSRDDGNTSCDFTTLPCNCEARVAGAKTRPCR